ncbi:MAG: BCCT family transporter, partial [Pseudomonadota bacterium]|nr:BCCT family transporter [Pseudomonadota bacterium]
MDNPDSKHPADEPVSEGIPAPDGPANLIDTDYVIGQDNITTSAMGFNLDLHGKVFTISSLVVLLFVILTLALQDTISPIYDAVFGFLTGNLAWFFILAANIFVLLCLGLIVSPLGKIRIGGADAKPDFTYTGWFSMLFAAGMGIGLMFFGVNEPLTHFGTSLDGGDWAPLAGAEGDTAGAAALGMAATIFHWGLHPWAIYAVVALSLALFSFNKGLPLS